MTRIEDIRKKCQSKIIPFTFSVIPDGNKFLYYLDIGFKESIFCGESENLEALLIRADRVLSIL